MSIEQKDLELIEHLIYKGNDDVAVAIGRSFERLEDRIDGAESRTYSRLSELEDKIESARQNMSDEIGDLREEIRGLRREELA